MNPDRCLIIPFIERDVIKPYKNEIIMGMIIDYVYEDEEYLYHLIDDIGLSLDSEKDKVVETNITIDQICDYIRETSSSIEELLQREKQFLRDLVPIDSDEISPGAMMIRFSCLTEEES